MIGQRYLESIRTWPFGITMSRNVSVTAIIEDDYEQRWRYFGITVLGRSFGLMIKAPHEHHDDNDD